MGLKQLLRGRLLRAFCEGDHKKGNQTIDLLTALRAVQALMAMISLEAG